MKPAYQFLPLARTAPAGAESHECVVPWTKLTYSQVAFDYLREHVAPAKCDWSRSFFCLMNAVCIWGEQREAKTIARADGRLYVETRRSEGVSNATIRRELAIIKASLMHAVKEERLEKCPKFSMPKAGESRMRWLTSEEWMRLRQAPKPARVQRFLLIAFLTGVRSRAIEQLTWDRVDLDARTIDFRLKGVDHKNKRRPIAPINDELLPRLRAMYETRADEYVIGRGPKGAVSSTYPEIKKALRSIGIDEPGVARHVARHTFCSWRVQAGFSYAHVGKLVGDTAAMLEKVYSHLSPHHLMAASNMDASALRGSASLH